LTVTTLTPRLRDFLSKVTIKVKERNVTFRAVGDRHCKITWLAPGLWRLEVLFAGSLLVLHITQHGEETFKITVKEHKTTSPRRYTFDVYFGSTVLVDAREQYPRTKIHRVKRPPLPLKPSANLVKPEDEAPANLVSIIILNYNTLHLTRNCIASVLRNTVYPYELIVVDNGSRDGSAEWLKKQSLLTLIANARNLSFSKANNQAIKECARGKHVLLLNSDIIVRKKGWLQKMVECAESSSTIGTVGAKLFYGDGTIQHIGGGIHKGNPYHPFDKSPADIPEAQKSRNVAYNTGACLLIKRGTMEKIGLLDEGYPFGFEDVDYGLQVVENGLRNIMCAEAELTHLWAYTQRQTRRFIPQESLNRYRDKWLKRLGEINRKVKLDWGKPCEG